MKKRIIALLLVIMTICPLIVACGSSYYEYDSYKDMIILGDVSEVQVKESDIQNGILGIYYDYFSDEISSGTLTSTSLTSGSVLYGDTVNIDYNGYKRKDDGTYETTPFEGGSTYDESTQSYKGTDLEIGSGAYIDGFESGLIGHEIGETVSLYLTFPETYGSAELAGKKVRFDVVINKITKRYNYDEMSDQIIKEQSDGEFETVAAFTEKARETSLKNLIWAKFYELCKVKKWPEKELKNYYYNSLEQYKSTATMMGTTLDAYASYVGYSNGEALRAGVMSQARQQCKQDLIVLAMVEENKLTMSEKDLEKAMKAIYKEAVDQENGYTGSYSDYLDDYNESAVRISAYTDVVMDNLLSRVTTLNIIGKNGIYGTAATGIYYYINDVKQTGWQNVDLDGDGVSDKHFFDPELDGRAYSNMAVYMKPEGENTEKYLKFGDKGIFKGIAEDEVVFVKLTSAESDKGGYAYIKNNSYLTGLQLIDRTGAIEDTEQYLFGADGYMYLGARKLNAADFNLNADYFGELEGKYYNFGGDGIFNFDTDTKTNGKYGEASSNAVAHGIIDEKAYTNGDMVVSNQYKDSDNNVYYFDENGVMAKARLVEIDGTLYYFDNGGKMLKGTEETPLEQAFNGISYTIDKDGKITSAKYLIDGVEQKDYVYTDSNGNVYYFAADDGQLVRNSAVTVTLNDVANLRCFDAYGKMYRSANDTPISVTVGGVNYSVDKDGVATVA